MNRKDEINNAGHIKYREYAGYTLLECFKLGAEWADSHPKNIGISVEHRLPQGDDHKISINMENTKTGIEIITEERIRQIGVKGYTPEHDDEYQCGELSDAAVCYATRRYWRDSRRNPIYQMMWPFKSDFKPTPDDRIKELAKAGALIASEIDRLQRLKQS